MYNTYYHYFGRNQYVEILLKHKMLWFSDFKNINDPSEYFTLIWHTGLKLNELPTNQFKIKKLHTPMAIKTENVPNGFFSLSNNYDNYLMWSHYANNHKGICIGFNFMSIIQESNEYRIKIHKCFRGNSLFFPNNL